MISNCWLECFSLLIVGMLLLISPRDERSCIAPGSVLRVDLAGSGGSRAEQMSSINPKSFFWYACIEMDACFDLLVTDLSLNFWL